MHRVSTLALLASAACTSPAATPRAPSAWPSEPFRPALRTIAAFEDARTTGDGLLLEYLRDQDPLVRERAATALGRLPSYPVDAAASRALLLALHDAAPSVRAAACFAIGQRREGAAAETLIALALDAETRDVEPTVRAAAIEALSKLEREDARLRALEALRDTDARVRLEAVHGPHRWSTQEASATRVNGELAAHATQETNQGVLTYALATLERRRAAQALEVFKRCARDGNGEVALFAVRGLRSLAPDAGVAEPLERALSLRDWRAVCEAVQGLGAFDAREQTTSLAKATRHEHPHVRRSAWEALAGKAERAGTLAAARELHEDLRGVWLDKRAFEREPSPSVRAAFIELELPLLSRLRELDRGWTDAERQAVLQEAQQGLRERSPVVLAGLARACGRAKDAWAEMVALELSKHPAPFVATQAIEALAKHPSPAVRARLHELCAQPDNGLRLAAVTVLGEAPTPADLPALELAFRTSVGDVAAEVRFNVVRAAGKLGGDRALALVREAELTDRLERPFLGQVAREELERTWKEQPTKAAAPPRKADEASLPFAGDGRSTYAANPRARVRTERGEMVFELFAREAPLHVENFVALSRSKAYDGLSFHRVVPDFVVQGGDYRGDGNGGKPAFGDALRQEITPRKFQRGSLGMPRNDDLESGGSQVFVTHRATPPLDGRYTLFGELVAGGQVLDRLEVGDRILSVRIEAEPVPWNAANNPGKAVEGP